ncbi:MAG: hypothetical protein M1827_002728 [Pycnora praestabilis]|nr:MAG: hypothetical protein M1827_002728 [Pycnora praestabilis]
MYAPFDQNAYNSHCLKFNRGGCTPSIILGGSIAPTYDQENTDGMNVSSSTPVLYIIYNAKASLAGKLNYAYRKLKASTEDSPCAACDLTHGGLSLTETAEWTATKRRIHAEVKQLHTDELDADVIKFVQTEGLRYPIILGRKSNNDDLKVLMQRQDLQGCNKSHSEFLSLLEKRGLAEGLDLRMDLNGSSL